MTKLMTPVHPGEILKEEFMRPLGLSANGLARAVRVPPCAKRPCSWSAPGRGSIRRVALWGARARPSARPAQRDRGFLPRGGVLASHASNHVAPAAAPPDARTPPGGADRATGGSQDGLVRAHRARVCEEPVLPFWRFQPGGTAGEVDWSRREAFKGLSIGRQGTDRGSGGGEVGASHKSEKMLF